MEFFSPFLRVIWICVWSMGLSQCSSKPVPKAEIRPTNLHIGQIELVNTEQRFVLLRTRGVRLHPGAEVFTFSPSGLKASLVITPERKSQFLIADIKEGYPQLGGLVFAKWEEAQKQGPEIPEVDPIAPTELDPNLHWGVVPGDPISGAEALSQPPHSNPKSDDLPSLDDLERLAPLPSS